MTDGLPGDGMEEEVEFTVEPPAYPDLEGIGVEEKRRAFITSYYLGGAAEIDGRILVQNMAMIEAWLRDGATPEDKPKRKLKAVEG